ncbi:MAG: hypothetical protein MUF84_16235 [Anaerolineae bacterium]|nr:hypothetical protein [Anaerolineae bacterium]
MMGYRSGLARWMGLALLLVSLVSGCGAHEVVLTTEDPTAMGRWSEAWGQVPWGEVVPGHIAPTPTFLKLTNAYTMGPFDHTDYRGYDEAYAPEQGLTPTAMFDPDATAIGKDGTPLGWQPRASLEGTNATMVELSTLMPAQPWSVLYVYAEVEAPEPQLAELRFAGPESVVAWLNGEKVYAPAIPWPTNLEDDRVWVGLKAGTNRLLLKAFYSSATWRLQMQVAGLGDAGPIVDGIERIVAGAPDPTTRMVARYALVEASAALGKERQTVRALEALKADPIATSWDGAWADAVAARHTATGSFMPIRDVDLGYEPVTSVTPYETFWPQSGAPAQELWVLDVSQSAPEVEFAMAVLQGLVNRTQPRLYLLHTRYARQDRMWLEELEFEGFTWREVGFQEVWGAFTPEIKGAILYDAEIMEEIGAYRSDQLNQTNVLMSIGALEDAVPLTEEMATKFKLPVVFDARGKWTNQYEMMAWAYNELFPRMNHRILATNYPGIFLLTDYLVQHQIFTFWFPEKRTLPEEVLLRGILASTPPNTPIVGWWFDWMPNAQDPEHQAADAVMEWPGLLRGSYFGKVLTPSHEATNLSVHSGVAVGPWEHKAPATPELEPDKVYYAHVISDGDNLGEALMMRTRDLQWDTLMRGTVPMGWSFAPAAARMAPTVLNYYLRTTTPNDLLVGGLGVGYTEPDVYLRAYPEQRETLYATYAALTSEALGWIDTDCLWLIRGTETAEDRYARGTGAPSPHPSPNGGGSEGEGQLAGIFNGYGGSPETASVRIGPNGVVVFRPATSMTQSNIRNELIDTMVGEIRAAAGTERPAFVEAWVLNWAWSLNMLQEVEKRLGPEYVLVRPDVLVTLAQRAQ